MPAVRAEELWPYFKRLGKGTCQVSRETGTFFFRLVERRYFEPMGDDQEHPARRYVGVPCWEMILLLNEDDE